MTVLRLPYGGMAPAYRACATCSRLIRRCGRSRPQRCRWCARSRRLAQWRAAKQQDGIEARYRAALAEIKARRRQAA